MAKPTDLARPTSTDEKVASESVVKDFALMISTMSRLLTRFASIELFWESEIGLPEWIALSIASDLNDVSNKDLARRLGVTSQRANQLTSSLVKAEMLSVSQSTEDSRKKVITVTEDGKAKLKAINAELEPLLVEALGKRIRTVANLDRQMLAVLRVLPSPKRKVEEKDTAAK